MTTTAKEFLKFVSENESVQKELKTIIGDVELNKGDDGQLKDYFIKKIVPYANAKGFNVTFEDFAPETDKMGELNLDELDAVTGGSGCNALLGDHCVALIGVGSVFCICLLGV